MNSTTNSPWGKEPVNFLEELCRLFGWKCEWCVKSYKLGYVSLSLHVKAKGQHGWETIETAYYWSRRELTGKSWSELKYEQMTITRVLEETKQAIAAQACDAIIGNEVRLLGLKTCKIPTGASPEEIKMKFLVAGESA